MSSQGGSKAPRWEVAPAGLGDACDVLAFFERVNCPCYCQFDQHRGGSNSWLEMQATLPSPLHQALEKQLCSERLTALLVRSEKGQVIGWARLAPAAEMPKIYQGRLYKGLPCFAQLGDRVWTMGCFLVDPSWRRQGVARALLAGAISVARQKGASQLQAFPRDEADVADECHLRGPPNLFTEAGFVVVHASALYPVFSYYF